MYEQPESTRSYRDHVGVEHEGLAAQNERIRSAAKDLVEAVEVLRQRLTPILLPESPEAMPGERLTSVVPLQSPVREFLCDTEFQVRRSVGDIHALLNRVDL